MAHKIDPDACIMCGACEVECPTQSISEVDGILVIDPATCTDDALCVEVCPVDAISKIE